jgi:Alginate export
VGKIGDTGLDFEVEGAGQFGTVGGDSVAVGMVTTVLGYTLAVTQLSPRVYLEFDYASGDKQPDLADPRVHRLHRAPERPQRQRRPEREAAQ